MINEISYSASIPLLCKIKRKGLNYHYYTFRSIKTGEVIDGIEYPVIKYKISAGLELAKIIYNDNGGLVYIKMDEKDNFLHLFDIDPVFKEELEKNDNIIKKRKFKRIYNPPRDFEYNPELYQKIKKAIQAKQFCHIQLDGRYYRTLRDVDTGDIILEFLLPVVKYTINLTVGEERELKIEVDNGIEKYKLENLETIEIYELQGGFEDIIKYPYNMNSSYSLDTLKDNQERNDKYIEGKINSIPNKLKSLTFMQALPRKYSPGVIVIKFLLLVLFAIFVVIPFLILALL